VEIYNFKEYHHLLDKGNYFENIRETPWYHDAVYPRFSETEFKRRQDLMRELMGQRGYECLIVSGGQSRWSQGGSLTWLSGLVDKRSMAQYMVLPLRGEPLLVYGMGGAHAELVRRVVRGVEVQPASAGRFADVLVERIQSLGLEKSQIGVLEAVSNPKPEYLPHTQMAVLQAGLPHAQFEFAAGLFHEAAYLKSEEEIEAIHQAGKLADAALHAMIARAQPGAKEYQLVAAATRTILAAGGQPDYIRVGSSPGGSPYIIAANPLPSQRELKEGDLVLLEVSAGLQGVTAQVGNPLSIGEPAGAVRDMWENILSPGFSHLEDALKPGSTLNDIQAAASFFNQQGCQSAPLLLHGLDIMAASPWVYAHDLAAEPYEKELKPGMILVLKPNPITADGKWGMCASRTYGIVPDGSLRLTEYPLELAVAHWRSG
jgi:Xaa-Pro aminopeptidase